MCWKWTWSQCGSSWFWWKARAAFHLMSYRDAWHISLRPWLIAHNPTWPLALEKELKTHLKMISLRPSLGCQWTSFSRFVKSFRIYSAWTCNLDIWIFESVGPLAACSDNQGPSNYSHEPIVFVYMEARPTRVLSNARRSRGNVRASVCFSCFGSHMRRLFHFNDQPTWINEIYY